MTDEPPETPREVNERFQRALERLRDKFDADCPPGQLTIEREERPER